MSDTEDPQYETDESDEVNSKDGSTEDDEVNSAVAAGSAAVASPPNEEDNDEVNSDNNDDGNDGSDDNDNLICLAQTCRTQRRNLAKHIRELRNQIQRLEGLIVEKNNEIDRLRSRRPPGRVRVSHLFYQATMSNSTKNWTESLTNFVNGHPGAPDYQALYKSSCQQENISCVLGNSHPEIRFREPTDAEIARDPIPGGSDRNYFDGRPGMEVIPRRL